MATIPFSFALFSKSHAMLTYWHVSLNHRTIIVEQSSVLIDHGIHLRHRRGYRPHQFRANC
ncbi:protein of unknown function (plasmid) [Cupriavidus taiwanensis]|uniref:Uncharacterized protein n=1 Tax=Cupriavidus taiwanensis TaxID=164546 RepID=A0A375IJU6_9BURK|nr:hypothetical protein CBM2608_B100017 [Cupriavidus taiwanensis]SPA36594.1 hypothetical protein CBM2623_B90019 [Cupriavidus taiwanensis]SPK74827.1 protein of unknown function [Cupriavidus taiwanensis]